MANIPTSVYITHLEREGSFVKVWGQTDRSLPIAIEKALQQMTPHFEQGMYSPAIENFQVGIMCCAKFKDELYYRARITNVSYLTQGMVEVLFVDYGNRDVISCMNTRTMSGLQTGLISIPAQAKDFILANVTLHNWDLNSFEMICRELRYIEFQLVPMLEVGPYTLISLYLNKQDISETLVERGLLLKIPIQFQQMTLQPLIARSAPPGIPIATHQLPISMSPMQPKITPIAQPVPMPTLLTYKALPLDNESEHQIYVSYVSDGPCLFSVQLKKMEEQLKRLMTEINCMELQPLEEYPLPGTVCLAQSSEDGYICRAVVTSMVDGEYKVFYVDFGNTELLPFDKLFQIPFKYVIPKVMATRFALVGLENATVSIEMKCKFKDFVNNRPLFMKVKPAATKSALPLCELWDDNNIKAIDMIKQAALLSYPEQAPLSRGLNQDVKVCFVYSCNKIYVQLKSKEIELQQLMNNLQETCYSRPLFNKSNLKVGSPCCVLFDDDNMWYRGEILQIDGDSFKVKYVDFGNETMVEYNHMKVPLPEHITALRPQAIECCLNGYQNYEPDEQRDLLLEELIFEQDLSMKVVEIQGSRVLTELYDKQHYNVASLLLEKIASATSMVSPLLIQDNHQIEHRKRSPPEASVREFRDKKPLRELNDRNRDRQENWRQNKFSRSNDDNCNEEYQTDSQNRHQKTSNRHNEPDWRSTDSPEKQNSFDQHKRFNDQRGKHFASRDDNEDHHRDNFENKNTFVKGKRNEFKGKGDFEKRDDFNRKNGFEREDGFERRGGGFEKRDGHDGFKKFTRNQSGQNRKPDYGKTNKNPNDSRSSDEGFSKSKVREHKRDGSEKSWSDASEKSWKKGTKSFDKHRNNKFGSSKKGFSPLKNEATSLPTEDWNTSLSADHVSSSTAVYDYAADTDKFKNYIDLSGTNEEVSVSWFYNPINFYCQLDKYKDQFREMMEKMQLCYRNRPSGSLNAGAPAVAPFSEDNAVYRVEILSSQFKQYHVKYVDYGNVATVNKVYPIEKKYMDMPAQAIPCGLQGISQSDNWPKPDTYSLYFDKDHFNCNFISLLENRYSVDLTHNGNCVSTLLIEAGLALSTQTTTDIDINLLISQQIVLVLRDVMSLNDITLEIENGVTVKASMHNLKDATEVYEDILKKWIGHFVIVYVDNVLEDRLEITLYELTGQKLQIVVPDEGAYDNLEPLCPLPIYTDTIQGCVSHASEESIYIQPSKFSQAIEQQLDALYEHYNDVTQEELLIPVEGQVYAVLSSDSNWYRGSVTEVKDDEVIVTFVDYGNTELVPIANLRELSPLFYQPHMLAVEILIPGEKQQYLEKDISVSITYGSLGWEGQVISEDVLQTETVATRLEEHDETAENVVISSTPTKEQPVTEETAPPTQIGAKVIISHIDTPSEFYLQLSDASESISHLQEELQAQIPSLSNLENPTAGVLCAAPYSIYQQWFRAQVLDADDDITTVRFVDFGNTDVITNSDSHVKTLPSEMLSMEFHAKLCSLNVKPTGEEWSAAALELFENYASIENLQAEIIHQDEKTTYVELYADGENIGEILKQKDLAVELQLETESSSTGFISHLNSPSEFWIQLESSCTDLEWVADQLSNADNYPALEDLTPGSLCAAIFSGDDSWYRARILSNTVAGLEVIFIDYGNSCSCNGLRELPEDLIMLPPLALKCSLQKPNGVLQWSQAATEKFKEISADGATVFNVNVLTAGETAIVQLIYNGMDVSLQLTPETRQCFITHVDALESFWVQFMEDNAVIENMTAEMENADSWPVVTDPEQNSLVAALFEDGVWYRTKILGKADVEYEGFFVDYGNKCYVADIRQLPENCAEIKYLATNYKLDILPRTKLGEKSEELFVGMTACGATMFDAELVSENILRLYLNGIDIRSNLEYVKCTPLTSLQSSPTKKPVETERQTIPEISEMSDNLKEEIVLEVNENDQIDVHNSTTSKDTSPMKAGDDDFSAPTAYNVENTKEKIYLIEKGSPVSNIDKVVIPVLEDNENTQIDVHDSTLSEDTSSTESGDDNLSAPITYSVENNKEKIYPIEKVGPVSNIDKTVIPVVEDIDVHDSTLSEDTGSTETGDDDDASVPPTCNSENNKEEIYLIEKTILVSNIAETVIPAVKDSENAQVDMHNSTLSEDTSLLKTSDDDSIITSAYNVESNKEDVYAIDEISPVSGADKTDNENAQIDVHNSTLSKETSPIKTGDNNLSVPTTCHLEKNKEEMHLIEKTSPISNIDKTVIPPVEDNENAQTDVHHPILSDDISPMKTGDDDLITATTCNVGINLNEKTDPVSNLDKSDTSLVADNGYAQIDVHDATLNEDTLPMETGDDNDLIIATTCDVKTNKEEVNLIEETSPASNVDKPEVPLVVEECSSISIKKIVENHLENIIEKAINSSDSNSSAVEVTQVQLAALPEDSIKENLRADNQSVIQSTSKDKTVKTEDVKTNTLLIKSNEDMSNDSQDKTVEIRKSASMDSRNVEPEHKCDITSKKTSKSTSSELADTVDIDNKMIECNETLAIAKADACDEGKLNVEIRDIGHSPEEDKTLEEIPTDGQNKTKNTE